MSEQRDATLVEVLQRTLKRVMEYETEGLDISTAPLISLGNLLGEVEATLQSAIDLTAKPSKRLNDCPLNNCDKSGRCEFPEDCDAPSSARSVPSEIADSGALADILMDSLKEAGHVIGLATALHVVNAMRFRTIPSAIRQKCEHVTCDDVNALISGRDLLQRIHDDLKIRAEFNDDESVVDLSSGIWRDLVKYLEVK